MALITTYNHFAYDPVVLPNAVPETGNTEADKIQQFIAQYEPIYLRYILGYKLYSDFIAGVGDSGKYDKLRDGDEYTRDDETLEKWDGFSSLTRNPIACFIYFKFQKSNASNTYAIGETVPKVVNATRVSPEQKMRFAWNAMVEMNWILHEYLLSKDSDFPTYIGIKNPPFVTSSHIELNYHAYPEYQNLFIKIPSVI